MEGVGRRDDKLQIPESLSDPLGQKILLDFPFPLRVRLPDVTICLSNCSGDETGKILKVFQRDGRVHVLHQEAFQLQEAVQAVHRVP